jgi:hypothetical protein
VSIHPGSDVLTIIKPLPTRVGRDGEPAALGLGVMAVTSVMLWPTTGMVAVRPSAVETVVPAAAAPSWTLKFPPNPGPAGKTFSSLSATSCPSATVCTAVGYSGDSSGKSSTLAERWNGRQWSMQYTPNPSGLKDNLLFGVSCSLATACTAEATISAGL